MDNLEAPTTVEEYRDALDWAASMSIENGVDQSEIREEAEKFADRTRLTEFAAKEVLEDE